MIKSGQLVRRSKHIDVKFHYVSEQYREGLFEIQYCNTDNQLADILTKALQRVKFEKFRNAIMKQII